MLDIVIQGVHVFIFLAIYLVFKSSFCTFPVKYNQRFQIKVDSRIFVDYMITTGMSVENFVQFDVF